MQPSPKKPKSPVVSTEPQQAPARPVATATVGLSRTDGRESGRHVIELVLEVLPGVRAEVGVERTMTLARKALDAFAPAPGDVDRRKFQEVSSSRRKPTGTVDVKVVGINGEAVWNERPSDAAMESLCAVLAEAGYKVQVRERRECAQRGCSTEATIDWKRNADTPSSWFSASTCGKHNLKECGKCRSVYLLTSYNAAGQAPSVHCEICSNVLIEWGSSKRWDAELVTRGEWTE